MIPAARPRSTLAAVAAIATLTLAGAFAFQHLGGLTPCPLCIWQRWPYVIGVLLILAGLIALRGGGEVAAYALAAAAFFGGSLFSGWHAGVEYGFWLGPETCAAPLDVRGRSAAELLADLETRPLSRCDKPAWTLAGVSLAGWSALILLGLGSATARVVATLRA